ALVPSLTPSCGFTSVVALWAPQATASIILEATPQQPIEGQNILIKVHGISAQIQDVIWYQGKERTGANVLFTYVPGLGRPQRNGSALRGRDMVGFPNGSLLIQNARPEDSGTYLVTVTLGPSWMEKAQIKLQVWGAAFPDLLTMGSRLPPYCPLTLAHPFYYSWANRLESPCS
uniref:Immunoglobulin domain-containing protein n=1 Tax=Ornithorhynchus anatinus TaxID=9258 RepID=A0A6I8NJ99_ORNAN